MRRVVRRLSGSDSWDKAFLMICIGDSRTSNMSIPASAGAKFVDARPTEDWTKVRSRRTYLDRNFLERHGRTLQCLG